MFGSNVGPSALKKQNAPLPDRCRLQQQGLADGAQELHHRRDQRLVPADLDPDVERRILQT
jgi:hypothetical protein